jgi:uncharacterized membrane protein YkvA (DUF1232 family)
MKNNLNFYTRFVNQKDILKSFQMTMKRCGIQTIYSALLLYYTYKQKNVPIFVKQTILGVLGYLISPIDLIPDLTPIVGFTDDIGVLSYALVALASYVTEDSKLQAKSTLQKWLGTLPEKDIQVIDQKL